MKINNSTTDVSSMLFIMRISASLHDVGKLSKGFQDALLNNLKDKANSFQLIRHEYISFLLVNEIFKIVSPQSDLEFFTALSNPTYFSEAFNLAWRKLSEEDYIKCFCSRALVGKKRRGQSIVMPSVEVFPVTWAIFQLVLTHHRLPYGGNSNDKSATDEIHVNLGELDKKDEIVKYFTLHTAPMVSIAEWFSETSQDFKKLSELLPHRRIIGSKPWQVYVAHFSRTNLIWGDHHASFLKTITPGQVGKLYKANFFANTKPEDDKPFYADTWLEHTHKVRHYTTLCFFQLTRILNNSIKPYRGLSYLDIKTQPKSLIESKDISGPYGWQNKSVNLLLENSSHADLTFLMAGTGSGKTRAGPKILMAGKETTRFTCALGLVSLTLQSNDEYIQKMGIERDSVSCVVGSTISRLIHSAQTNSEAFITPETSGTDTDIKEEISLPNTRHLERGQDSKVSSIIQPAVLVSTIDMIMSAVDASRGGHLVSALRIASSDIIIDEIDSYSPEDICQIAKLVYLHALAGRAVVISSATISPSIAYAMRSAYKQGRYMRSEILNSSSDYQILWSSNLGQKVFKDNHQVVQEDFEKQHTDFLDSILVPLREQPIVRKRMDIDIRNCKTRDAIYRETANHIPTLHDNNKVQDPKTGRHISVGIVRFNNIRSARGFAEYLLKNDLIMSHKVICYHSRFTLAVKNNIEKTLLAMLTRKPAQIDPILNFPRIREWLDDGGTQDICLIISTTSIIEVGRDFDSDWSIVEPCYSSTVVQLAGRVQRHRKTPTNNSNVAILSHTIDTILSNSPIQNPGLETKLPVDGMKDFLLAQKNRSSSIFPTDWLNRIDATDSIKPTSIASIHMENARKVLFQGGVIDGTDKLSKWLSLSEYLDNPRRMFEESMSRLRVFRRSEFTEYAFFRENDSWNIMSEDGKTIPISSGKSTLNRIQETNLYDSYSHKCFFTEEELNPDLATAKLVELIDKNQTQTITMKNKQELSSVMMQSRGSSKNLKMEWDNVLGGIKPK